MLRFRPFRAVAAAFLFSQLLISYVWFGLVIWPALAVDERPRKLRDTHERNALRLYDAFVTLKGVYVKIGQFLSTQAVLLPAPYLAQMVKMQDRNPSASEPAVRARIRSRAPRLRLHRSSPPGHTERWPKRGHQGQVPRYR